MVNLGPVKSGKMAAAFFSFNAYTVYLIKINPSKKYYTINPLKKYYFHTFYYKYKYMIKNIYFKRMKSINVCLITCHIVQYELSVEKM